MKGNDGVRNLLASVLLAVVAFSAGTFTQSTTRPTNDAPNPYQSIPDYFKLPDGRSWGSTSAVEIDRDGRSIWVAERCGANSCFDRASGQMSMLPSVLEFDADGRLTKSFGQGMLVFPHGIFVVNILGSALIGIIAGIIASGRLQVSAEVRTFIVVGILGGFTTFSSFSLDTFTLFRSGHMGLGVWNVVGQVGLSLVATAIGFRIGQA